LAVPETALPPRNGLSDVAEEILASAKPNTIRNASTSLPYPRLSMTPFSVPSSSVPPGQFMYWILSRIMAAKRTAWVSIHGPAIASVKNTATNFGT